MAQAKKARSTAPTAVRQAVHDFRRHHEKVDRTLKLMAASALHLEQACSGDGKALIASLVAQVSTRWSAARLPRNGLRPAVEFAATATLVAALAAFEDLGDRLASTGHIHLPKGKKQPPDTSKAGVIAKAIVAAAPSPHHEFVVLVNYFGRIRNAIAHAGNLVSPDATVTAAFAVYSTRHRNGLPALPTSAGHLAPEQVILASALCLKVGESLL
jgi:hypothetical protein